jgi:hypothetical protein
MPVQGCDGQRVSRLLRMVVRETRSTKLAVDGNTRLLGSVPRQLPRRPLKPMTTAMAPHPMYARLRMFVVQELLAAKRAQMPTQGLPGHKMMTTPLTMAVTDTTSSKREPRIATGLSTATGGVPNDQRLGVAEV